MIQNKFHEDILAGIPAELPQPKAYDTTVCHAPKRKDILSAEEKVLAIKNALRYFPAGHHAALAEEFAQELNEYGRIYMYRFRPDYEMYARPIDEYPAKSRQAAERLCSEAGQIAQAAIAAEAEVLEIVNTKL